MVSLNSFPILHGKYLYYHEYVALFGCILALVCFALLFILELWISNQVISKLINSKLELEYERNNNSYETVNLTEDPESLESKKTERKKSWQGTNLIFGIKKPKLIKIYVYCSCLSQLALLTCFIMLISFNVMPFLLGYLFIVLGLVYKYTRLGRKLRSLQHESLKHRDPFHLKTLFLLSFAMINLILLLTYKSCLIDHVDTGIPILAGFTYSSTFTRWLTISKACPPGPPCQAYVTLPTEATNSIFLNVHTHVDVQEVKIYYDTQEKIKKSAFPRLSASAVRITPDGMDFIGERNIFSALLTNLSPNTTYYIGVYYNNKIQKTYTYLSLPHESDNSSYNIIYGGDIGHSAVAVDMSRVAESYDPRAIFIGGDASYDNGEAACYHAMDLLLWNLQKNINEALGRLVPIVVAVGNHDIGLHPRSERKVKVSNNGPSYFTYFPQNLPRNENNYEFIQVPELYQRKPYSVHKIGKFVNFVLDTGYVVELKGEQLDWLADTSERYQNYSKIAVYHNPIYAPCYMDTETGAEDKLVASILPPIFEKYKFLSIFENHSHSLKKTFPLKNGSINIKDGVVYFGDGSWGVKPSVCSTPDNSTGIYEHYSNQNHIWVLEYNGAKNIMSYKAVGRDGRILMDPYIQTL